MSHALSGTRIAFVGAGSMAEAIIRGLTEGGVCPPDHITVINRSNTERLKELEEKYQVSWHANDEAKNAAIAAADIVVLAFKPKDALSGFEAVRPYVHKRQLLVSVLAGVTIQAMQQMLGSTGWAVVRSMPNTSSTIGLGATGISFTDAVTDEQRKLAAELFTAIGTVAVVSEPLIDVVTGVSGSGPAYIYYMMEAMIEAGVQGGLTAEDARKLTVQTVLGAASMVAQTGEDPAALRRKVTSPNGTTQAALETLAQHGFQEAAKAAVLRAAERAGEMGQAISESIHQSRT